MRYEEKVRFILAGLFLILILNSIIIFGNARENFFGKDEKEKLNPFENGKDSFGYELNDKWERDYGEFYSSKNYIEFQNSRHEYLKKEERKDYFSKGEFIQNPAPIGYTNDFKVYLKNNGDSIYFNVIIYTKTADGIKEYKFRRYVFSGEKTVFYFRELSKTENKFLDWSYEIEN